MRPSADPRAPTRPARRRSPLALACLIAAAACGGVSGGPAGGVTSEAEWRALRAPRPEPLSGAAPVTVSSVDFVGGFAWPTGAAVARELGVAELVVAGLLRRRDVDFVERRRFSAAAEAERSGVRRPAGQPPAGVSRSAEFSVNAVWLVTGADRAAVEVRLVRLETGAVAGATRVALAADVDAVTLARAIVDGTLTVLADVGRRPTWADPLAVGNDDGRRGVSTEALDAFLRGLAREEVWDFEGARRGYQDAARDEDFYEAATVLARAARLRLGGTLAES